MVHSTEGFIGNDAALRNKKKENGHRELDTENSKRLSV